MHSTLQKVASNPSIVIILRVISALFEQSIPFPSSTCPGTYSQFILKKHPSVINGEHVSLMVLSRPKASLWVQVFGVVDGETKSEGR